MNQLNPNASVETLVDGYGWYAVTRLDGNPDLAEVAAEARSISNDLDQAQNNYRPAARAMMSAASVRDAKKYQLDVALRFTHTAFLAWVHNRRSSTYYRATFSNGLAGAICSNVDKEIQIADDIVVTLTSYQVPELASVIQGLQSAIAALKTAVGDYEAALRARKEAWSVVQAAKVTFCRRYYGLYCQIFQIVGDPALAQTYFRRPERSEPASEDAPASEGAQPAVIQTVPITAQVPAEAGPATMTEVEAAHAA
jgi:hypothetical protein